MTSVDILKFPVSSPADTSPVQKLKDAGYDASQIMAVVGKCEGNDCVNDFSGTLSTLAWGPLIPPDSITIFSGGTEGVLSPHVTFFVRAPEVTGLLASVASTRALAPHEIGGHEQERQVSHTVSRMVAEAGLHPEDVHLVLIKCLLLTSSKIDAIRASGRTPVTDDPYESMAKSRQVSAMGIGQALKDLREDSRQPGMKWTSRASCSSGAELEDCHILLLALDPKSGTVKGSLRACWTVMNDAMDARSILHALEEVHKEKGEVVQVFVKAEADPRGKIRGNRHTMCTDSDIQSTRHARAAVGGLVAGLVEDSMVYVSGGAEGQGPSGGGGLCIFYQC